MEFQYNKKELKKFFNILLFRNRRKSTAAEYVSLTNGVLWRRDEQRLIAFTLQGGEESDYSFNYSIKEFEDIKKVGSLAITREGSLKLEVGKEQRLVPPNEDVPLAPNALTLLGTTKWDAVFEIPSEFFTKYLSYLQQSKHISADEENLIVRLDLTKKQFQVGDKFMKELPVSILENGGVAQVVYAFSDFKELLINAIQFDEKIRFHVRSPFFTKIQLSENIASILNHKKGNA